MITRGMLATIAVHVGIVALVVILVVRYRSSVSPNAVAGLAILLAATSARTSIRSLRAKKKE